ncbi:MULTISPECIES: hypothetical protein [unclassified Halorubrum]|uniref:hypothetical protein n=1 Tax=unclassified Halorubrum TaxID=2642239 RepID=UPI0010F99C92|nr:MULTISPECIES: hypothetical protein [unclassified Halorubrum]TKX43411.1 hypothetical protein EXE50_11140 [Halorubrum sp. ARQ200]TKX49761.1 hypothetical protein EXE49_09560 [Halorubrum sp. ASP121]
MFNAGFRGNRCERTERTYYQKVVISPPIGWNPAHRAEARAVVAKIATAKSRLPVKKAPYLSISGVSAAFEES